MPQTLPPWAKEAIRWGLGLLIVFLTAKYGIQPPELPPVIIQTQPGVTAQVIKLSK